MTTHVTDLGPRICILGPSSSGKSTLAVAIGTARDLPVVHLDRLYFQPGSDWRPRPNAEFVALHDAAIADGCWVMDGNYSQCLPQRLARATGLILLDLSTPASLLRYVRRTLCERGRRIGALDGGRDSVKWEMIRHIAVTTRRNRRRYAKLFEGLAQPHILLPSARMLEWFYEAEGLTRPGASPHARAGL